MVSEPLPEMHQPPLAAEALVGDAFGPIVGAGVVVIVGLVGPVAHVATKLKIVTVGVVAACVVLGPVE